MNTHQHLLRAAGTLAAAGLAVTGVLALPSQAASTDAAAGAVPACTVGDLSVAYHGTDAAMSHRFGRIVLTNVSDHACRTGGYGGLSYVGDGDGTQIGAAATRDHNGAKAHTIVMKPGQHAVSEVSAAVAGVYPKKTCRPASVDGFRVYIPNETHSVYVKHHTTGCRNPDVDLLTHQAFT